MAIHHCITKHYFNDVDLMGEDGITGIYIGIPHHSYHIKSSIYEVFIIIVIP
jgi:hypothetical protein